MLKRIVVTAAAVAAFGCTGAFAAGTVSVSGGNLGVNLNLQASCTVATASVDFGSTRVPSGATAVGTVTVDCTNGTDYAVGFGAGNNNSGTTRRMQLSNTGNFVPYEIFSEAAHTNVLQDVNLTTGVVGPGANVGNFGGTGANSTPIIHSIYGLIPSLGASKPTPGGYSDQVAITIIY